MAVVLGIEIAVRNHLPENSSIMFQKKALLIAFTSLFVLISSCAFEETAMPEVGLEKLRLIDVYYNLTNPDIKASVTIANVQGNFSLEL